MRAPAQGFTMWATDSTLQLTYHVGHTLRLSAFIFLQIPGHLSPLDPLGENQAAVSVPCGVKLQVALLR